MPVITYQDNHYNAKEDESVLDTLLRNDIDIPYSCKAGVCHVCVMHCEQGTCPDNATDGLEDKLIKHGFFLACKCNPSDDLTVCIADESRIFNHAVVVEKDYLSDSVCRLKLKTGAKLHYRAGQYLNIRSPNGQIRSYSLASLANHDEFMELQIKRMKNGVVSNWLFSDVSAGETLEFQGPFGECHYQHGDINVSMLMIGTGTGLAPLVGILRDAIEKGHKGRIDLYHGVRDPGDLYLDRELRAIASAHANIQYFPCVTSKNTEDQEDVHHGRAADLALTNHKDLNDHTIYLCGSPAMVTSSREQACLQGADNHRIHTDPFVTKDLRAEKDRPESNEDGCLEIN